jgi:hypothetical protein
MTAIAEAPPRVFWQVSRSELLMVVLVAVFAVAAAFWSDRIPISNGLGWDGAFYGRIAADPLGVVRRGDLDGYGVQRILPSVVVHVAIRAVGADPTPKHIVAAFEALNALLLTLGSVLWVLIARALRLAPRMAWLGWLGLFVNFASMRQASYYAVLTDTSAFAVGLAMLLAFLRGRRVALAALTLAGAFIWPVATAVGLLLIAVPPAPLPERDEYGGLSLFAAFGASLAACVLTSYIYFVKHREWHPGIHEAIIPSIILVTAFVAVVTLTLLRGVSFGDLRRVVQGIAPRAVGLAAGVLVVSQITQRALVHDPGGAFIRRMLLWLGMFAVAKPFNFFVPHVLYFGPIVCVMAVMWPLVTRVARQWGLGIVGVILLTIGLGVNSESRQAILGYPFLVAVTVVAISRVSWPTTANWWVAALGLLASKIWMPMPLVDEPTTDASIVQYPMQWYFMNHGPWITVSNYVIQSVFVAIVTGMFWVLLRGTRAAGDTRESVVLVTRTADS